MDVKSYAISLLLVALPFLAPLRAQSNQVFISGEVVEKGTDKHIPFAMVVAPGEKTGTKADQRGFFRLPMLSASADTLTIMAVGYQPQRVPIQRSESSAWVTAEMVKKPQSLNNAATASANAVNGPRMVTIGSRAPKKSDGMLQGYPGTQYAFWVKNDGTGAGILKSVAYFIDALGFPSEQFRVRVYKAKPNNGGPGEELLSEKVVVSCPKGGQWFTVDLSKYFIPLPEEGVFVAMEWLVGGESFVAGSSTEDYTPYGQILSPTYEFKDNLTWNYTVGKKWAPLTTFDKNRVMNAMIHAEVAMY